MNEDFYKNNSIGAELQVRLMNLVMGESSDFESDQLHLLMEERAEVAAYYQHIEHLHGLLLEVGAGDPSLDVDPSTADDGWQLSADRRVKVLAVLDGNVHNPPTKVVLANSTNAKQRPVWSRMLTAGSLVTAACVLLGLMLLPSVQSARKSARRFDGLSYTSEATPAPTMATPMEKYFLTNDVKSVPSSRATSDPFFRGQGAPNVLYLESAPAPAPPAFGGVAMGVGGGGGYGGTMGGRAGDDRFEGMGSGLGVMSEGLDFARTDPKSDGKAENSLAQNFGSRPSQWSITGALTDRLADERQAGSDSGVNPNQRRFGDGLSNSLSSSVDSPRFEMSGWEMDNRNYGRAPADVKARVNTPSVTVQSSVRVPDGGQILLGGIRRYREVNRGARLDTDRNWNGVVDDPFELRMTVTPRIIIPEEEEEKLGDLVELSQLTNPSAIRDGFEDASKTEWYENGLKSHSSGDFSGRKSSLGWKFTPAPSPEAVPKQPITLDEQSASTEAFSTFSLHVSDVSFKLAQTALSQGQWPEAAKIRIEEFVNALDYHDPLPSGNQKVACRVEQALHPFLMQRNLLRVSMRTAATGRSQNTPLRLTMLLDNSGSMERPDRRQAVLRAFQTLTGQLRSADQVTLISFASTPRLLADKVPGNQGETLLQLVENLPSEGGTNIEAALLLAREKAVEQQLSGAQNRIVLLTDGAVNLGNANPESLAKLVTQLRDAGIAFDAAGISAQDLNDEVLEALTRQGDGRYYLLDSAEAASESFAAQIAGALRPSAQNVKVQVEFNPKRVGHYKLLGFEKHRLNKEDFSNDQVDAAEMAAAEAGVAVYQFEVKPNGSGDVGSVSVRFRDLSTGQMVERRWPIPFESNTPRLEQAQASMQLAAAAALFAAKLSGGPLADYVDLAQLQKLLSARSQQAADPTRVQQLRTMIEQAMSIGH